MHKCRNCGTEFDSKFCPECGTPAPPDFCPNCGTSLLRGHKFCPNCGTSVGAFPPKPAREPDPIEQKPAPAPKKPRSTVSPVAMKVCTLLPYAPSLLFALFSVLLFLMLLGSAATTFGIGLESIYGFASLAGMASDGNAALAAEGETGFEGMALAVGLCIGLIVCAVLGIILAAAAVAFRCYVPLRVKKIRKVRICTLFEAGICIFYFIDFLLSCILCGAVSDPVTSPGSGTVCVLVFSLLFGLCTAAAIILQKFLVRIFPIEMAEIERVKAEYRAETEPPVPPEKELVKPQYNFKECPAELQMKIEKNARARNLIIIFSVIIFMLLRCLRYCLFPSFETLFRLPESVGEMLGMGYFTPTQILPSSWLMWPATLFGGPENFEYLTYYLWGLWGIYVLLTIILGSIFGKKYYRKPHSPNFNWRSKKAWSRKWSLWTVAFVFVFIYHFFFCYETIFYGAFAHYGSEPDFGDINAIYAYIYTALCFAYMIAFMVLARKNTRKRKNLSLAICGANFPWKIPALKEQYFADEQRYIAERRVWKAYCRALAYYEEGIPHKT